MNYFSFHVGDYAAHTSHLEAMEDLAYRRMLDLYYLREEPLPADPAAVARLIRLRSNVADVQTVLQEFFSLSAQGWMHSRCDDEIGRMREKQGAVEEKEQHEKDRMVRYRERRAEMFAILRERGVVPAWDIGTKDLQRMVDETCNAPATPPVTEPVTPATSPETGLQRVQAVSGDAPATAISTNTNTNTNTSIKDTHTAAAGDQPPETPEAPMRVSMPGAICMAMKAVGLGITNPHHPDIQALIDKGADIGMFVGAAQETVKKQKGFAYALGVVKGQMADAAALADSALAVPQKQAGNGNKQEALEQRNRQVAAAWAAGEPA